ncbi:MAG TPA: tetratricopeptide repeat protein [Candidatus Polarisedimenticolaceae bacterium]|nr:tetratricopeptide repeat protein [Candidatus Polarisedimenticolaceae bacterium]
MGSRAPLLLLCLLAAACARPQPPAAEAAYVGPGECARCHAEIAQTYARTGMGQSWYRLTPANAVEDFTEENEIELPGSGVRYRMTARDGRFYMRQFLRGAGGKEAFAEEHELKWVVGSNHHSRAYVIEREGKLFQTPICWYPTGELWDLCPGFDTGNEHFRREISASCVFCHNARMERVGDTPNLFRTVPEGIDCERCHGPGSIHVARWRKEGASPTGGPDPTIVNPDRLPPAQRRDVCFQCHLGDSHVTERVSRRPDAMLDWRPGQPMADAVVGYTYAQGMESAFGISAQADRLARSPCFRESRGQLDCTTCHDPHVTVYERSPAVYREACLECHQPSACRGAPPARAATPGLRDDCVQCHMRQAEPDDQRHTTITDHWIRAVIEPPAEREVYRDLALEPVPLDAEGQLSEAERAYLRARAAYALAASVTPQARAVLWQSAEEGFRRAIERGLKNPDAPFYLGKLLGYRRRGEEAIEKYREALALDPHHREAAFSLGQALLARGDAGGAQATFDGILERRPEDAGAIAELGRVALQRGQAREALTRFERALAIEPWNARLHGSRAVALAELGRKDDAVEAARQAVTLDPESPDLWEMLAGAAHEAGRSRESQEATARAAALRARRAPPAGHGMM